MNKTNSFAIKPVTIVPASPAPAVAAAVAPPAEENKPAAPRAFMGKTETPAKAKIIAVDKAVKETTVKTVEVTPDTKNDGAADAKTAPAAGSGQDAPAETNIASLEKADAPAAQLSGESARVQLGAFRSEKEAGDQWSKISKTHASLLSGKAHDVVRADLGAKGVYYRLQVTGISGMAAAKSLCSQLAAKKQACLPVASQ